LGRWQDSVELAVTRGTLSILDARGESLSSRFEVGSMGLRLMTLYRACDGVGRENAKSPIGSCDAPRMIAYK